MIPMQSNKARFLRLSLLLNALFSTICGLLMLIFNDWIVSLIGVAGLDIRPVGAMLLVFAGIIVALARQSETRAFMILIIIFSDVAWVLGSAALLLTAHEQFTGIGQAIIGIVAVVVADFAVLQWIGMKRALSTTAVAS